MGVGHSFLRLVDDSQTFIRSASSQKKLAEPLVLGGLVTVGLEHLLL